MRLNESPKERLKGVTLGLLSDKSGPNVILGVFVTAFLQALTGRAPWSWAAAGFTAWVVSVLVYSVADEVSERIEEQKNKVLSDESDYPGIE